MRDGRRVRKHKTRYHACITHSPSTTKGGPPSSRRKAFIAQKRSEDIFVFTKIIEVRFS